MAKALADASAKGRIVTFDLLPHNIKMYWNCIDDLEEPKTRAELLSNYFELIERFIVFHQGNTRIDLPKIFMPRIHFAFLDGAHTYKDVMYEFKCIKNSQKAGDIIFFDDYTKTLFPGVVRAIDEICSTHKYLKTAIQNNAFRSYAVGIKM